MFASVFLVLGVGVRVRVTEPPSLFPTYNYFFSCVPGPLVCGWELVACRTEEVIAVRQYRFVLVFCRVLGVRARCGLAGVFVGRKEADARGAKS